jgi:hypothetical protein
VEAPVRSIAFGSAAFGSAFGTAVGFGTGIGFDRFVARAAAAGGAFPTGFPGKTTIAPAPSAVDVEFAAFRFLPAAGSGSAPSFLPLTVAQLL